MFEIKSRWDDNVVIYKSEDAETLEGAILEAVAKKCSLQYANLQYANLQDANLQSAKLQDANLQYANLQYANLQDANLQYAKLQDANLQYAKLQSANLQYAKLQSANLQSAKLQSAKLQDANLQYANLQYANLQSAKGLLPLVIQPLEMLKLQPGPIRLFKMVTRNYGSPVHSFGHPTLNYEVGSVVEVPNADTTQADCGAGVNVATLDWLYREYWYEHLSDIQSGNFAPDKMRLVEIEFNREDIASIPLSSSGKIRLHRGKVVAEHNWFDIGLLVKPEAKAEVAQ